MMNENNNGFPLQLMGFKSWFLHKDSTEDIISSRNRKTNWTAQRIIFSTMDTINHILIVLVTLYVVYHAAKEYSVTNVHVILCTIGVSILCSTYLISILVFNFKVLYILDRNIRSFSRQLSNYCLVLLYSH